MRGVNFYLILMIGSLWIGPAFADEGAGETARPDLQSEFMSKPITAKQLYLEAWKNDNLADMGMINQMEYMQKNSPVLDSDMKAIMRGGIELMKKMNFGLKGKDITEMGDIIQKDPEKALRTLSEGIDTEVSFPELISIVSETIEPGQRLLDKVYHDRSLGSVTYSIDVDAF